MVPGGQPDRLYMLLVAQGVHPKIVQERLGHADISMTLNRYSHVTPDMQRSAADVLDVWRSRRRRRLDTSSSCDCIGA
jgi:integrase